jgi:hypothetical protein
VSDYSDLKNDIVLWLADADIVNVVPTFIRLCEMQINRELDTLSQETTLSLTVDPTTNASGTNFITLPADFDKIVTITSPQNQDNLPLDYVSPDRMVGEDSPYFYSVKGDQIMLPTGIQEVVLTYSANFPELTDTEQTNWLTANAYDALLYGSLTHAEGYVVNVDKIPIWDSAYTRAISAINEQDNIARTSGNTLRVI